jgi:hypothetical protein
MVIGANLYRYVYRGSSITNTMSARHILDYLKCYDILQDFLVSEGLMERYRDEFTTVIGRSLFYHSTNVMESGLTEAEKAQYLRHMLILKLGFVEHGQALRALSCAELQALLRDGSGSEAHSK